MHNESTHVPNPDDGYEISDVKVKVILIAGVGMVAFTLLSFAVSFMYGKVLNSETHEDISEYTQSELAGEHNEWESAVRLQPDPPAELSVHKAEQRHLSTTSGIVSESPEIYRIPIEDALKHVAEHGFPKRIPMEITE